ncbi:MAG: signal peptidase I [Clostridia bacterium]|nr:signal peptidase I [Clostridia bacterium]
MAKKREKTENETEVVNEKERRSNARFCAFFLSFLLLFLLFVNFWTSNFSFVLVSGASMDKTLYSGEYLLSYKVVKPEELERGDIIVVRVDHIPEWQKKNAIDKAKGMEETHFIIKRLIALEGDKVRCIQGKMEICYAGTWNEEMSEEELPFVELNEPYAYYDEKEGGKDAPSCSFEYTVGEDEIFFLGDNRNHSKDSRYVEEFSELDRLYKETDVESVVPAWALKKQVGLQKYLVEIPAKIKNKVANFFRKIFD